MKTVTVLFGSVISSNKIYEIVYLLFRLHIGISIAIGAGLTKMFHKIDEKGDTNWDNLAFGVPDWFVKQVNDIGFTFISPSFWAALATYGEFVGGLLIALGLLTRLSAFQLAFQFFVIAFVWYEEPSFITGMYYQQLFFWGFALITAKGGGKYSLDQLFVNGVNFRPLKPALASLLVLGITTSAAAKSSGERVNFSVKNSTLKSKWIEFKHFDNTQKKISGYGYLLSALGHHSTNMPVGTRIYKGEQLVYVVSADDNGKSIDINKQYEISRETWLDVSYQEMNEKTAKLDKVHEDKNMEVIAKQKNIPMVTFKVKGSSVFPSQVHVRAQLPWDTQRSTNGFSTSLSLFSEQRVSFPVGTKVYLCDGPYWKKGANFKETLIVTVDEEKSNYTFKL